MASLLRHLLGGQRANETVQGISVTDWSQMFRPGSQVNYGGRPAQAYQMGQGNNGAVFAGNPIVYTCEAKRISVFSEMRFQYQRMANGRAGDLWGDATLSLLETPWPGASTRDLLKRAELDAATAGNSYWILDPDPEQPEQYLLRLDPAGMRILTSGSVDPISGFPVGEQLLGYVHYKDATKMKNPTFYPPEAIAHYAPTPDPAAPFRGMSWMSPCLPDVEADNSMTAHKVATLRSGAYLGYVVSMDPSMTLPQFRDFVEEYKKEHEGPVNAGKTLFLGGGADVKTVGQSFDDLAFEATQGAGATRIAGCSQVPVTLAGLSEGLKGSTLNAGNYKAAKENFVDAWARPAWGDFASAIECLRPAPSGSRLWYDDRDIPFLREDILDQAEVTSRDATTIRTLIDGGYEPDAAVDAVASGDMKRLTGQHTGYVSVQLQQLGQGVGPEPADPPAPAPSGAPSAT
jgi:hypothetical protein